MHLPEPAAADPPGAPLSDLTHVRTPMDALHAGDVGVPGDAPQNRHLYVGVHIGHLLAVLRRDDQRPVRRAGRGDHFDGLHPRPVPPQSADLVHPGGGDERTPPPARTSWERCLRKPSFPSGSTANCTRVRHPNGEPTSSTTTSRSSFASRRSCSDTTCALEPQLSFVAQRAASRTRRTDRARRTGTAPPRGPRTPPGPPPRRPARKSPWRRPRSPRRRPAPPAARAGRTPRGPRAAPRRTHRVRAAPTSTSIRVPTASPGRGRPGGGRRNGGRNRPPKQAGRWALRWTRRWARRCGGGQRVGSHDQPRGCPPRSQPGWRTASHAP